MDPRTVPLLAYVSPRPTDWLAADFTMGNRRSSARHGCVKTWAGRREYQNRFAGRDAGPPHPPGTE